MPTGVAGLDLVLNGGLEPGSVVVVAGAPGTGKTILAQQMCFAGATAEHRCVYYTTMSEPHNKVVRHLEEFSFFDPAALGPRVEYIHMSDYLRPERQEGLEALISEIVRKTLDEEPAIVVVDSAKMLGDFAGKRDLRRALYDLTGRLASSGAVLLLLGEYTPEELRSEVVFSLADGIIQLEYEPREPLDRRWLRIVKMRGGSHSSGKHTFRIGPHGVEVFPRVETLVPRPEAPLTGQVPSGIPGLDELMGGGARQSDASLVTGPSGVGKTVFGLRWLVQGIEREENCLYVTFQDTGAQLTSVAAGFGWDVAAYRNSGQLVISYVPMGDLDLDVLATSVRSEISRRQVSRVVIDSLSELAFAAREEDRFAAYMRSLVGLVRAGGSSLLLTSETNVHGVPGSSLDGLMFLFDNTIDLRYIEEGSQIGRAVHIAKMRSRGHAMTLNSVTITDHGLEVGEMLDSVTGRLGWSALRTQGQAEAVRRGTPANGNLPAPNSDPGTTAAGRDRAEKRLIVVVTGQHQASGLWQRGADFPADRDAVTVRQPRIEHCHVRTQGGNPGQRRRRGFRLAGHVNVGFMGEQVPYTAAEDLVIIDEENADPVLIGLGAEAAPTSHRLDGLPPPLSPTTWV